MTGVTAFHDGVSRSFDDSFFRLSGLNEETEPYNWKPPVDVYEKDDVLVIKAELPGLDKKEIAIDLKDGLLTLKGERVHDTEVEEEKYYRKKRVLGKLH